MNSSPIRSLQTLVRNWVIQCFGLRTAENVTERNYRFLEESVELCQSLGLPKSACYRIIDYVYACDPGTPAQELGGVMITLSALASASDLDIESCWKREFVRISDPEVIAKIREKQAGKPSTVVCNTVKAVAPLPRPRHHHPDCSSLRTPGVCDCTRCLSDEQYEYDQAHPNPGRLPRR